MAMTRPSFSGSLRYVLRSLLRAASNIFDFRSPAVGHSRKENRTELTFWFSHFGKFDLRVGSSKDCPAPCVPRPTWQEQRQAAVAAQAARAMDSFPLAFAFGLFWGALEAWRTWNQAKPGSIQTLLEL